MSVRPAWLSSARFDDAAVGGVVEVVADQWLFATSDELEPLRRLRRDRPFVLHCTGLNLGSCDGLDPEYVDRVRWLADHLEVEAVSDHFAWRSAGGRWSSGFLPLPVREDVLDHVAVRLHAVQERLARPLALETPAHYVGPEAGEGTLADGLAYLHTCCASRVVLDVCNLEVSAFNVGLSVADTIEALSPMVAYVHVAGFSQGEDIRLDDHGSAPRLQTFRWAARVGAPVVVEWDHCAPEAAQWPSAWAELEARWAFAQNDRSHPEDDPAPAPRPPPGLVFSSLAEWQARFLEEVLKGEMPTLHPLFSEQVFAAVYQLAREFPETARHLGPSFRAVVRDFVRHEPPRDVHGLSSIPAFARHLAGHPGLKAHPEREGMQAEWVACG